MFKKKKKNSSHICRVQLHTIFGERQGKLESEPVAIWPDTSAVAVASWSCGDPADCQNVRATDGQTDGPADGRVCWPQKHKTIKLGAAQRIIA